MAEQTQAIPIAGATPVIGDAAAIRTALADILGLITEQEELTLEAASQQKSPRW